MWWLKKGRVTCLSSSCCNKYNELVGLSTTYLFLSMLDTGSVRSRYVMRDCLLVDRPISLLYSHKADSRGRGSKLSQVSPSKDPDPKMKAPPSRPHHPPKAHLLISSYGRLDFTMGILVDTSIQFIAVI